MCRLMCQYPTLHSTSSGVNEPLILGLNSFNTLHIGAGHEIADLHITTQPHQASLKTTRTVQIPDF